MLAAAVDRERGCSACTFRPWVGILVAWDNRAPERVVALARRLSAIVRDRQEVEHYLVVVEGGTHWFDAWRERLPGALAFLYGAGRRGDEERVSHDPADCQPTIAAAGSRDVG